MQSGNPDLHTDGRKKKKKEKAEILFKFSSDDFVRESSGPVPILLGKTTTYNIENFAITSGFIENKLLALIVNKSCGLNRFHPKPLLSSENNSPLSHIECKKVAKE